MKTPNRFWDKEGKFEAGFLKEYQHWVLELSFRQHTLGCYILFCKRPTEKMSNLTSEELLELINVMKEMEKLLKNLDGFKPDRFNYLQLGNNWNQLHLHGVPRYAKPRTFAGKEWVDTTYGNPPTWVFEYEDTKTVEIIKRAIISKL